MCIVPARLTIRLTITSLGKLEQYWKLHDDLDYERSTLNNIKGVRYDKIEDKLKGQISGNSLDNNQG